MLSMLFSRLLCVALALSLSRADIVSIDVQLSSASAYSGDLLFVMYNVTATDAANLTSALLYPYFNSLAYGAEVGLLQQVDSQTATGHAYIPVPWSVNGSVSFQLAAHAIPSGPTLGRPAPSPAVWSTPAPLTIAAQQPVRPAIPPGPLLTMYFEPWFTPLNFNWGGLNGAGPGEAIPTLGRYASVDLESMRAQAAAFIRAGVDALVVDWTNNAWGVPTWADRAPNVQELVNATDLQLGVYASLKRNEGWDVPRFILLLGLANGPVTPLPALYGELDYIVSAYLTNASVGADMFVQYEGKPLVVIFDGGGRDHSNFTHEAFTIRWMSSQNQETGFNKRGYWSWMDGSIAPEVTYYQGVPEAATAAPAFFAGGGWLDSRTAMGRSGGLTYVQTVVNTLQSTVGRGQAAPFFLHTCQWNEYAGQANGQGYDNNTVYVDSYSADLSNDMEPTSPYACAYPRPGRTCGGWGYRQVNLLTMMGWAARQPSVLQDVPMLAILSPAVGEYSNYSSSGVITVSWVISRFNTSSLLAGGAYLSNITLPVQVLLDGVRVGTGLTASSVELNVTALGLDVRYPHILSIQAQPSTGGGSDHLTPFPLSFDTWDASVPRPQGEWLPAQATAWIRLPEFQGPP